MYAPSTQHANSQLLDLTQTEATANQNRGSKSLPANPLSDPETALQMRAVLRRRAGWLAAHSWLGIPSTPIYKHT